MIYSKLLENIKPDWSAKEKARSLYYNIGKNIIYDENFMYGTNPELLLEIYNREPDPDKDEPIKFVCNSANKLYLKLLQRAGVKAEIIYKKSGIKRPIDVPDVALVFFDEQGNKYFTNIVGDIENCRYTSKTVYFGTNRHLYSAAQDAKKIESEELREIDLKTGNIHSEYSDIAFKLLVDEVKNTNNFKKFLRSQGIDPEKLSSAQILENKMQFLNRYIRFHDKIAGPSERNIFYRRLFCSSALDKFESKHFNAYTYVKETTDGIDSLSVLEINPLKRPSYYIFSKEEETYLPISVEDLIETTKGYYERKNAIPAGILQQTQKITNNQEISK